MGMSDFKFSEEEWQQVSSILDDVVEYNYKNSNEIAIESIERIISARSEEPIIVPYQCCPKCNGQGTVSKPPHLAGDVYEWSDTVLQHQCNVCNGQMIIPQMIIPKQP